MASAVVMWVALFGVGRHLIAVPIDMGDSRIRRRNFDARRALGCMRNRAKPQRKGYREVHQKSDETGHAVTL